MQVSVLLEPLLPEENGSAITREIQHIIAQMVAEYEDSFYATVIRGRGRPALDIHEYQLRFLLENFFTMKDIAGMFSCSTRTIQRRLRDFGIEPNRFSDITDAQLDEAVNEIVACLPACGIRSVQSRLRADGVLLQRERVRESLHRVDPVGLETRLRRSLHRRQYCVPTPNALWHIDGYHKLIRWRFVIHGGIDG